MMHTVQVNPINIDTLVENIHDGEYLLGRGWFVRNIHLQQKVQYLKNYNVEHHIFAIHGDFEEHVDYLTSIINQLSRYGIEVD